MTSAAPFTIRPATPGDTQAVFAVFRYALVDLFRRSGTAVPPDMATPAGIAREWPSYEGLYSFLATAAEQYWVAERDGQVIGYARSVAFDGLRELTEFFVHPDAQSGGVGRELLNRAFPLDDMPLRSIIATTDPRAQRAYLGKGVYPYGFAYQIQKATPEPASVKSDLAFEPMTPADLDALTQIDRQVLGYRREAVHRWLISERQGWTYRRRDRVVGYGYEGQRAGPFALLDPADFPAVLAHAESAIAGRGVEMWLVVPGTNRAALDHLLSRQFQVFPFAVLLMSNKPFGQFDRYVITNPEFIL